MSCFLCKPNKEWVYAEESNFFAMLGLGPIVEGFSLIATKKHIPSMMDLPKDMAISLCQFTSQVREILKPHYGEVIITEHGRVAACIGRDRDGRSLHCFHAHRLVFPTELDLTNVFTEHNLEAEQYSSFLECQQSFAWKGEYLYYERQDGTCIIAAAPVRLVRQFFRYKMANAIGLPELANWKDYPLPKVIEHARKRLLAE